MPGTGPLAFAALPFDRGVAGELIVPAVVVGRDGDGLRWLTIMDEAMTDDTAMDLVGTTLSRPVPAGTEPTEYRLRSVVAPEVWRDEIVAEAVRRIRAGAFRKVVLAREAHLETDAPIDPALIVERLKLAFPPAIVFMVDGFLGASPELLVARHGDVVRAHPLAGTTPRSADPAVDQRNAAQLLASTKNRHEHAITIDWLIDCLLPHCSYVDAEPEPSIVTLANVHHLGTVVEGRLSTPSPSVLELVAATHPTPALGATRRTSRWRPSPSWSAPTGPLRRADGLGRRCRQRRVRRRDPQRADRSRRRPTPPAVRRQRHRRRQRPAHRAHRDAGEVRGDARRPASP